MERETGLHPLSNIEWWYSFGFMEGERGNRLALVASFFRMGEIPCFKGHYLIFSLIDLNNNCYESYSFIDGRGLKCILFYMPYALVLNPTNKRLWSLAGELLHCKIPPPHQRINQVIIKEKPLSLQYGNSSLLFAEQLSHDFRLFLAGYGIEACLNFTPGKPLVPIGENGKLGNLQYYSSTHNYLQGNVEYSGKKEDVIGQGWYDHQWGRDYSLTFKKGWDWFGIQLADGRELLLAQFLNIRDQNKYNPVANLIERDGTIKSTPDVEYFPLRYWESPFTHAVYPVEWKIVIPDFKMYLYIKPFFDSQEIPVLGYMQAIWEGACTVVGKETRLDLKKRTIQGKGFMELVGYANRI